MFAEKPVPPETRNLKFKTFWQMEFEKNISQEAFPKLTCAFFAPRICVANPSGKKTGVWNAPRVPLLQFPGFAYANPVGFPLQSRMHGRAIILQSKIMTSQDAWASSDFALAKS
jgi:hypothetical protein